MATPTPNLGIPRPDDNADDWGDDFRAAMTAIDTHVHPGTGPALQVVDQLKRLEWFTFDGSQVPRYIGAAPLGTATSSATWAIARYSYQSSAQGPLVTMIERKTGAWDNRASLF